MTTGYTKRALIRDAGYPVGTPAPVHVDCACGRKVPITSKTNRCGACGSSYDTAGWLTLSAYRVYLSDGTSYATDMAAGITLAEARAYFVGQEFEQPDERLLKAVRVEIERDLCDYQKTPIAVGDCVRNIESGWKGRIKSVEGDGLDTMLVCKGINFWTGTEDEDDTQWHAPDDVVKAAAKHVPGEPVNANNFL